ncbi:hypothetical protein D9757_007958 [Collybiopsis confluens]|uniref:Uncharacterized protein n=1 Tax=Collybiopsis confluens TaxID=2823264 RepID=A0A8H5HBI1_9AGAR|nr:hypothetical protein D9757_007958 [Collybiopsis confluens]
MVLLPLQEEKTVSPCFGISTRASTSTPLRPVTMSTPSSSHPTDTGSAQQLPPVKIFDLESKSIVDELKPAYAEEGGRLPECVSIAWSADGQTLFAGFTDNALWVWTVVS